MNKFNTEGIVLKNINYKDAAKIYTLLTESHGKISAAAYGVRKISSRRSGNLDTLSLVSVKLCQSDHGFRVIEEVILKDSFKNIKASYETLSKVYYLVELVNRALEEDADTRFVFKLLEKTLKLIDKNKFETDILVVFFEVQFLKFLGYMPKVGSSAALALEKFLYGKLPDVTAEDLGVVKNITREYIKEHLGFKFKSLEI